MVWRKVDKVMSLGMVHKDFRSRDACKATEVVSIDTEFHLSLQSAFSKGTKKKKAHVVHFQGFVFFRTKGT